MAGIGGDWESGCLEGGSRDKGIDEEGGCWIDVGACAEQGP